MLLPCYAGPVEGRVDYQFSRALAHSAAEQSRQKFTNKDVDDRFALKSAAFSSYTNWEQTHHNALFHVIYTLLNAFAKDLMLIL